MRTIEITVSEFSGTPGASVRHFEARLDPHGDVLISGVDDDSWFICQAGSPAALSFATVLAPSLSRLDDPGRLDSLGAHFPGATGA